ncbi:MAG: hypothetical protein ACI9WU_002362 [Myxococcota bacterium]
MGTIGWSGLRVGARGAPGLNQVLLDLRQAVGIARIGSRVAGAARAQGHAARLDTDDRALGLGRTAAGRVGRNVGGGREVRTDVVTAAAAAGVAAGALGGEDRLNIALRRGGTRQLDGQRVGEVGAGAVGPVVHANEDDLISD